MKLHVLHDSAAPQVPKTRSLRSLKAAARSCRGCPLYARATQTVFGDGPARPRIMLVGEQPGHEEDLAGQPFVGPAGRLLDRALAAAGIDRSQVYVTNVVKHFKWTPRGKRRLHQRPGAAEIEACRPWLDAELFALTPEVLVCLGASAAQTLISKKFKVTSDHGKLVPSALAPHVLATVHPSSILRSRTSEERERAFAAFVADLAVAKAAASRSLRSAGTSRQLPAQQAKSDSSSGSPPAQARRSARSAGRARALRSAQPASARSKKASVRVRARLAAASE